MNFKDALNDNRIILVSSGSGLPLTLMEGFEAYEQSDEVEAVQCGTDHGERTNRKIKDQPFYRRGKGGKMRSY